MRVRVRIRRRRDFSDESGVTIVVVTMALMAICGMLVLVVDVGGLLTLRRKMVTAADSAALAAAQSCAADQPEEASDQADLLATSNQPEATRLGFDTTGCGTASSGSAFVEYSAPKKLAFAPILGYPDERPVPAEATAIWGSAGGALGPVPVELSVDTDGDIDCAYAPLETQCAYWHDNGARPEWDNSSHWGWLNLDRSDMGASDGCSNAGSSDRRDWIAGTGESELTIEGEYTLVCADSGHSSSSWSELQAQVGTIRYFPVNDPARMVTTNGREKYAIIGFIPLRIDAVLKGNDPAAVGSTGTSGKCDGTASFVAAPSFDIDSLGCSSDSSSIANLSLTKGKGKNKVVFTLGVDYTFDPNTHVIQWFGAPQTDVTVNFDWAAGGSPGACGSRDSDPNGICLVLSWQGPRIGGSLPGNGADFGLRAVRLDK
jgi:hypothetical protein